MFKIDEPFSDPCLPRTVLFTPFLSERLATLAQRNNISFNLLVLKCCQYALDNLETANS